MEIQPRDKPPPRFAACRRPLALARNRSQHSVTLMPCSMTNRVNRVTENFRKRSYNFPQCARCAAPRRFIEFRRSAILSAYVSLRYEQFSRNSAFSLLKQSAAPRSLVAWS